jgi:hypothetical protein
MGQPVTGRERPIIFSAPMVRAILDGSKTQTRRKVLLGRWQIEERDDGSPWPWLYDEKRGGDSWLRCPYGQPGDRLWVREKFQPLFAEGIDSHDGVDWKTGKGYAVSYPATDGIHEFVDMDDNLTDACKPSIHMPRWASRITLEVTGIRVERLQDISEKDANAEGVKHSLHLPGGRFARENFAHLWWTIHGDESWEANPLVWVVEFKRC